MSVDDQRDPDYLAKTWDSYRKRDRASTSPGDDTATSADSFRSRYQPPTADVGASATAPPVGDGGLRTETADSAEQAPRTSRRARLRLSRIDPVSVAKVAFVISLVCFVALFVVVGILYGVLASMGVFEAVNSAATTLTTSETQLFPASSVFGYTFLAGLLNVVLMTVLATVGAVVYNVISDLLGGIEMTLTESDGR